MQQDSYGNTDSFTYTWPSQNVHTNSSQSPARSWTASQTTIFWSILGRQNRRARVRWCNTVRNWTLRNWRRMWFNDESRFMLQHRDGRIRVYRRKNERFANNCGVEVDRFGGGSVMMWGAITYNRRTPLILVPGILTAQRYRDEILQPHLLPVINTQRFFSTTTPDRTQHVPLSTFLLTTTSMCYPGHLNLRI
jgi:hypothetical protein